MIPVSQMNNNGVCTFVVDSLSSSMQLGEVRKAWRSLGFRAGMFTSHDQGTGASKDLLGSDIQILMVLLSCLRVVSISFIFDFRSFSRHEMCLLSFISNF
jgi:hypothetical protein